MQKTKTISNLNKTYNVLATVLDRKTFVGSDTLEYYAADVYTAGLYYAFGSGIEEMQYSSDTSSKYRYGFNGQEMEFELNKSITSAEFWMYDGRLGRRWNQDVVERPNFSPYGVLGDCPILYIDAEGNDWFIYADVTPNGKINYDIIWVAGTSVIYDPLDAYYFYLGPNLNYGHLVEFTNQSCGLFVPICQKTMLAPVILYSSLMNLEVIKELKKDGYSNKGGFCAETPSWLYDGDKGERYGSNMNEVFYANNNITVKNFYTIIMYSFLTGMGPENFYFDTEHEVSKSLVNSRLVTEALGIYKDINNNSEDAKKLRNGEWTYINILETDIMGILERAKEDGTYLNPEHLIGSAVVKITISEDGKNYIINIWNSTNLKSGTFYPYMPSNSRPVTEDNSPQPYTNVSQSYELIIPIK